MDSNTPAPAGGFDLNRPTIISLLYLGGFITGISGLVGLVLAFVWRGDGQAQPWEDSHYQYLINTFWIGLAGSVVGLILAIILIGFFIWLAVGALFVMRCVMSLINAQKREPMPNPGSWTI